MKPVSTGPAAEPWMSPGTCTDPDCNGSCGRISHPYALPADAETIGCG